MNSNIKVTIYGLNSRITFGKNKSLTIKEIIEDDPSYLEWALDEIDGFKLDDNAQSALERELGQNNPLEGVF